MKFLVSNFRHYFTFISAFGFMLLSISSCSSSKKIAAQEVTKTKETSVKLGENSSMTIPGIWTQSSRNVLTNQYFFKNADSVVIALSQNPVEKYPFYKVAMEDTMFVNDFYTWESEHYKSQGYEIEKIDGSKNHDYIVWSIKNPKTKVSLLYGIKEKKAYALSIIDPKALTPRQQIGFLIQIFKDN